MAANRSGPTGRGLAVRVKTAKRRRPSSTRWLQRQLNDPYVAEAKKQGLRSRAAFKLMQLDDRFRFLKPGQRIVDLGAAPGGWCQVAVERTKGQGVVVGLDCLPMESMPGVTLLEMDFYDDDAPDRLKAAAGGAIDIVLSDMAAPTTGHAATDHLRIMALAEAAYDFAAQVLTPGGTFVAKVFQGGAEQSLLVPLKQEFEKVVHAKPKASRSDSAETYIVALGFRGQARRSEDLDN